MTSFSAIDGKITEQMNDTIEELKRLCAQPSISAQGTGIRECAELTAAMLRRRGFTVEVIETEGHPVVYGEAPGDSDRTLLFYNHYDVQPPEPLELWDSPPFEPEIRDGKFYARGASDDKGHIQCRLAALDAIKAVRGSYPCRIKFIIEGEEEVGSRNLVPFVRDNATRLAADACVWEFGGVNEAGQPLIYLGLRGMTYVELRVRTMNMDAHSGIGGSIFPNAAWRLVWALNTLKGPDESILIPGFHDDVREPSARARELIAALPDTSEAMRSFYNISGFLKGMTGGPQMREEEVYRPTCTICGLDSGYQGPGSKTVLPATATAKIDFRLVPDQDPADILKKLRAHLDAQGFSDIEILSHGGEKPGATNPDDPFVLLTQAAGRDVYGMDPIISPMIGGSGPNHVFLEELKVPIVMVGVGYPESRVHSPNENLVLDLFEKGIRHTARIVEMFAQAGTP